MTRFPQLRSVRSQSQSQSRLRRGVAAVCALVLGSTLVTAAASGAAADRYLYQGMDPSAGGEYSQLPWRLGLLTQTNSPC